LSVGFYHIGRIFQSAPPARLSSVSPFPSTATLFIYPLRVALHHHRLTPPSDPCARFPRLLCCTFQSTTHQCRVPGFPPDQTQGWIRLPDAAKFPIFQTTTVRRFPHLFERCDSPMRIENIVSFQDAAPPPSDPLLCLLKPEWVPIKRGYFRLSLQRFFLGPFTFGQARCNRSDPISMDD